MDIITAQSVAEREDEGIVVHVRSEDGEPQYTGEGDAQAPVTITVAGTYSKTYRRATEAARDKQIKRRAVSLTGEQLARTQLEIVAACVKSWSGFTANGQPFPCTKENAVVLFESAPWVREQVEEAMGDHQGFTKSSSR